MATRICSKCQIEKNLTEFTKNKTQPAGRNYYCKPCTQVYKRENREHLNELEVNRRINNPNSRISHNLRSKISNIISKNHRSNATAEMLGIDHETFIEWISYQFTPDMNFGNYGTVWNFDHLIPLSKFNLLDEAELKRAMNWRNIQPIIVIKNHEKYNHIDLDLAIAQEIKSEYFLETLELNRIDPPDFYS
jgi:hypothetical protein